MEPSVDPVPATTGDSIKWFRASLDVVVVTICTIAFGLNVAGIVLTLLTPKYAADRDFVTYWAAGKQLIHHANPYDRDAVSALERSVGYSSSAKPLIMRNAPPALPIVLPLGLLSISAASLFWSGLMAGSLWISVSLIASTYRASGSRLSWLGYTFAPVLSCLIAGQTSLFVLLGLTLFLRWHRDKPFAAGMALCLCALKPQIFIPFAVVLVLWVVATRQYRVLSGLAVSLLISTGVALCWDSHLWAQYAEMMKTAHPEKSLIASPSMLFRLVISPGAAWLQMVPAFAGSLWGIIYFRRHRDWIWTRHGSLLMMVSLAVAPYSWFMDQAVLLPAVLEALYGRSRRSIIIVFALLSAFFQIANLRDVPLRSMWVYSWTPLAWLVWYLVAKRRDRSDSSTHERNPKGVPGLVPAA